MIVIIDYGMGNLRSAQKGLEKAGHSAVISDDPANLAEADGILLPGVGAFKDCYDGLASRGFVEPIREAVAGGKPLLGICVGMQLLFDESEEGNGSIGLGLLPGRVIRFQGVSETGLKVPHMGWNRVNPAQNRDHPFAAAIAENPFMYFVHSYYPLPENPDDVLATTQYAAKFSSIVGHGRVLGTQFHPEKSQRDGITLLTAFGDYVVETAAGSPTRP